MSHETITVERIGAIVRVALDRPDRRNAVNDTVHAELRDALTAIERDVTLKVMILTGTGDRAFCSGQDLTTRMPPKDGPPVRDLGAGLDKSFNALIRRLRDLPIPIVTALNGVAAGAGAGLALAGDVLVAARSASMVISFGRVGLVPDAGVTHHLPRLIGEGRALAAALTADPFDADRLLTWGIAWQVVDDADLPAASLALAERLSALPPKAILGTRRLIRASLGNDLDTQLDMERDLQRECGFSHDYAEGVTAFLEKRPPVFTGR